MNTTAKAYRVVSRAPGFGTVLLIALVCIFPLMVWGDRFPWLVAFPVAAIVFITARSEWARLRKPVAEVPVKVEAMLVVTADVSDFVWAQRIDKEWMDSVPLKDRTSTKTYCPPDKCAARNEEQLAVA